MTREAGVQPACALREAEIELRSRGETRAGADRRDVIEVIPHALELEQDRPNARELAARKQAERFLDGLRICDAVRDGAGCACSRDVSGAVLERAAFRCPLEPAVLVEEPSVDMEDLFADEVEAKVPRLDHAGVHRPDRDLVGVAALHRHSPAR